MEISEVFAGLMKMKTTLRVAGQKGDSQNYQNLKTLCISPRSKIAGFLSHVVSPQAVCPSLKDFCSTKILTKHTGKKADQ